MVARREKPPVFSHCTHAINSVKIWHMYPRSCNPLTSRSFFLFGPRATGKSSLLKERFAQNSRVLWINLLNSETYRKLLARPELLKEWTASAHPEPEWVVCDEIQKIPALLDLIHDIIEERKIKFALTGSSARKLKKGAANLLGGRALVNHLFPLTVQELGKDFNLKAALQFGTLPEIITSQTDLERKEILRAYVGTYLREEIKEEQIIRQLDPFVRFLEVAAQQNSEITNATKIGRDSQTDAKTIIRYFEVLQDTLMGFFLDSYQKSVRKVQTGKAKFYWFDLGVKRALEGTLDNEILEGSSDFGRAFEHFFIAEAYRMAHYTRKEDKFSYLRTKDDVEIDLVIERSKKELWAIEIKSSQNVALEKLAAPLKLAEDMGAKRLIVASRETRPRKIGKIEILPWQDLLQELYG